MLHLQGLLGIGLNYLSKIVPDPWLGKSQTQKHFSFKTIAVRPFKHTFQKLENHMSEFVKSQKLSTESPIKFGYA